MTRNDIRTIDDPQALVATPPKHVTFSGIHCHVSAYRRKAVAL